MNAAPDHPAPDHAALTVPQRRVLRELLAVEAPRPPADDRLAADVRRTVMAGTARAAALRPGGARPLHLGKAALSALECDGRYLDHRAETFTWSPATVAGTLAHRGIQLDHAGRRAHDVPAVVEQAWREFCASARPTARYGAGLAPVERDAIRAEAAARVHVFRECFPLLPPRWTVRFELAIRCELHGGAVQLAGRPDLVLGAAHPTQRRMLLVDLKTGRRHDRHRNDLRFYALLATLKYGTAPFRVATYYLDEADWEAEDVDADLLSDAARDVVDRADRAARLEWTSLADAPTLRPGPACGWCTRASVCPAAPDAVLPLHAPTRAA